MSDFIKLRELIERLKNPPTAKPTLIKDCFDAAIWLEVLLKEVEYLQKEKA